MNFIYQETEAPEEDQDNLGVPNETNTPEENPKEDEEEAEE